MSRPAEGLDGRRHDRVARLGLREVGLKHRRAAAGAAHAVGRLLGLGARSRVAHGHVDAARRKLARDDEADALAAGDERDFVVEVHKNNESSFSRSHEGDEEHEAY